MSLLSERAHHQHDFSAFRPHTKSQIHIKCTIRTRHTRPDTGSTAPAHSSTCTTSPFTALHPARQPPQDTSPPPPLAWCAERSLYRRYGPIYVRQCGPYAHVTSLLSRLNLRAEARTRRILLYIYRPLSTLQRERPCNVQSKMNTHTINVHENVHDCEGETYRNSYMHVPSPNPHPHSVALCVPRHTLAPRPGTDLQHEIAACVETRESQPPVAQTLRIHGHEGLVAYPLLVAVALVAHQVKPSPGTSSRPPERQLIKLT